MKQPAHVRRTREEQKVHKLERRAAAHRRATLLRAHLSESLPQCYKTYKFHFAGQSAT